MQQERQPRPSAGRRRDNTARSTSEFLIDACLLDTLCDHSSNPNELRRLLTADALPVYRLSGDYGCIYYDPQVGTTWERNILIRLIDGTQTLTSASRAAWAAATANKDGYLHAGQHAVHLCRSELHHEIRLCCINPAHIVGK